MKANLYRWVLAGVAATSLTAAVAAYAQVDTGKSTVIATSKQMNVPVDGKFKKFTAQISFDPAKPAAGSANISIDTGSYDLGDDEYNKQVRGKEWFDSATFPSATFASTAIAPAGTQPVQGHRQADHQGQVADGHGAGHRHAAGRDGNLRRLAADQAHASSTSVRANGRTRRWWRTTSSSNFTSSPRRSERHTHPGEAT